MFGYCSEYRVTVDEYAQRAYVYISEQLYGGEPSQVTVVLDSSDGRVLQYLAPGTSDPPPSLLAVGPRSGRLYYLYAHCSSRGCKAAIKVFDPAHRRVLRTVPVPDGVSILRTDVSTTIADGAGRVFVTNPQARTVTMLQVGP